MLEGAQGDTEGDRALNNVVRGKAPSRVQCRASGHVVNGALSPPETEGLFASSQHEESDNFS